MRRPRRSRSVNKLLEQFRAEYRATGRVRTSRHCVNSWYTDLRNHSGPGWLRQSVSLMTRQTLYDLARHYDQYVETEYLKACGAEPYPEWGEPRFRKHGDRISIPLHITHDNTVGDARFLNDRTIRISKMGDIRMSRPFPTTNYRPKAGRLFQTADGKWRITISCEVPDPEPYVCTPVVMGVDRNGGNVATPDQLLVPPRRVIKRMQNAERTARRAQRTTSRRQKPDGRNRKWTGPLSRRPIFALFYAHSSPSIICLSCDPAPSAFCCHRSANSEGVRYSRAECILVWL